MHTVSDGVSYREGGRGCKRYQAPLPVRIHTATKCMPCLTGREGCLETPPKGCAAAGGRASLHPEHAQRAGRIRGHRGCLHRPRQLQLRLPQRSGEISTLVQQSPYVLHGELVIHVGGCHVDATQRMACNSSADCMGASPDWAGGPFAWNEGDVQTGPGIYQVPLWVALPSL